MRSPQYQPEALQRPVPQLYPGTAADQFQTFTPPNCFQVCAWQSPVFAAAYDRRSPASLRQTAMSLK